MRLGALRFRIVLLQVVAAAVVLMVPSAASGAPPVPAGLAVKNAGPRHALLVWSPDRQGEKRIATK